MFPAMCFTMTAMEFDSGSSVVNNSSSLSCAIAPSAKRLCPRIWRWASSRYRAARSAVIFPSPESKLLPVDSPPAAPARRFDPDSLAFSKTRAELPWHLFDRSALADHAGLARLSRLAAGQAPWPTGAPVCQKRGFAASQHFNLADNSVTTAMLSASAAARAKRVAPNPQRIGILQRFRGSVQRIRHMRVHARDAGLGGARAHAASDRLIVSKRQARLRIDATDCEIVHRARCRSGNPVRNILGQRAQQNVDDPLRSFNIST